MHRHRCHVKYTVCKNIWRRIFCTLVKVHSAGQAPPTPQEGGSAVGISGTCPSFAKTQKLFNRAYMSAARRRLLVSTQSTRPISSPALLLTTRQIRQSCSAAQQAWISSCIASNTCKFERYRKNTLKESRWVAPSEWVGARRRHTARECVLYLGWLLASSYFWKMKGRPNVCSLPPRRGGLSGPRNFLSHLVVSSRP